MIKFFIFFIKFKVRCWIGEFNVLKNSGSINGQSIEYRPVLGMVSASVYSQLLP